jgi:DNA-binding NarL/FixJ family response regulator
MRALVVDTKTLDAMRIVEVLSDVGIRVLGTARSSGEAFLLAARENPDIVILRADLESAGAGHRLASKLQVELDVSCLIASEHDLREPFHPSEAAGHPISILALAARNARRTRLAQACGEELEQPPPEQHRQRKDAARRDEQHDPPE